MSGRGGTGLFSSIWPIKWPVSSDLARMLGVDAGVAAAADGGFEAVYVAGDGTERRVSLAALAAARLEGGRPVRSFPSYRGQRN